MNIKINPNFQQSYLLSTSESYGREWQWVRGKYKSSAWKREDEKKEKSFLDRDSTPYTQKY